MAHCSVQTGFLFWKKPCIHPSLGNCRQCRKFVCQIHSQQQRDGMLLCNSCAHVDDHDYDTSTESSSNSGVGAGIGSIVAGGASASKSNGSGGDSGSSDSGSSDSGGSSSD